MSAYIPVADESSTYGNLHALLGDHFHAPHDVFLHLDELRQLLGQVGPEGTSSVAAQSMTCVPSQRRSLADGSARHILRSVGRSWWEMLRKTKTGDWYSPRLPLPKIRPVLVEEGGGGGFCDHVSNQLTTGTARGSERFAHLQLGRSRRPRLAHRVGAMHRSGGSCRLRRGSKRRDRRGSAIVVDM